MDILYFLKVLLRRKWTILILSMLAVVAAFIFLFFKKDLYESVAQYSTGFTAEKVRLTDGSSAVDIYTVDIKFNNVIETFQSPRVIGMLSYKLLLHDLENPQKAYKVLSPDERSLPEYKAVSQDTVIATLQNKIKNSTLLNTSDPVEKKVLDFLKVFKYDYYALKERLITRRVERTDYIDIIYQSENPILSATVVNMLGTEFLNYYRNLNEQRNVESAKSIEQLVKLQQSKVDTLTLKLRVARISQGALDPVERTKSAMETEKELTTKLAESQGEYNLHSQLFATYTERIRVLNQQLGGGNSGDLLALMKRRDQLREENAKRTVPDPDITREIADLDVQISQSSGKGGASRTKLQNDLRELQGKASEEKAYMDAASATILQLNRAINQVRGIGNVSPSSQVDIDAIERQLEIENNELKAIREKLSQAQGLISDDPTTNFRQTLVGQPDVEPVPKRRIFTMGLAGMSVFMISALIFLMIEIFDSSIKTPSQFSKLIKLNLKGVINSINLKKQYVDVLMTGDGDGGLTIKEEHFKNSIRKLRHEIEKTGGKVFQLCSTQPGTGKTIIIQSLAFGFLLSKKKVIILDLNFENNLLSQAFHAGTYIEDLVFTDREETMVNSNSLIQSTSFENLSIIGCRGGKYSPSEVLSYKAFFRLIDELKAKFDFIFIESPALNDRSDSVELFRFSEKVITVFSAKTVPTQSDLKSVETIRDLKDKNFGAILNDVNYDNIDL